MQKELPTIHAVTQTEGPVVQAMIFDILREYNLTLATAAALVEAIAFYEQFGFQRSLDAHAAARFDQAWELDLT
jgi:hypothetical protein